MRFVAIDLFCGGGGATKGLIEAGFEVILSIDCWEEALIVHEANFPHLDILDLKLGLDIKPLVNLIRSKLLMFHGEEIHLHCHGSPPCQEISNASNHNSKDGMKMVFWFIEFVEALNPNSWSMENVQAIDHLLPLDIDRFLFNSANFGVAQVRKRIFAGFGFEHIPTHRKNQWVSIKEAIPSIKGDLEACPSMEGKWHELSIHKPFPTITSSSPKQIRINNKGQRRTLSLREIAILSGWNDMVIPKQIKNEDLFQIIGNMVSPPVMEAIGRSIIDSKKKNVKFTKQIRLFKKVIE